METSLKFGDFELFPERFELCRAGHTLRLERKPMEILILLTVGKGRVVTRTELAERLWGEDVFVDTEHGINTAVRKLRQALRDDPEKPRFIQTVPKLGYRFLAPVSTHPEPPLPASPLSAHPEAAHLPMSPTTRDTRADSDNRLLRPRTFTPIALLSLAAICLLAFSAVGLRYLHHDPSPALEYEQLTDLTDSAVAPAISPDGHTIAFIRGDTSFASGGPIYVKALPNGEDRLVSNDRRPKYGLAFSPDGSRVAYTVFAANAFATYTVSIFGGQPTLLLNNAAGLHWLSADQLLFSEVRSGIHLGVVTANSPGSATRDVYFPSHQRGMAHYAQASPDREWVLIVEMDSNGDWAPCRLTALRAHAAPRVVGPNGPCTAAAWSGDGRWMFFTAAVAGQSHLWRQQFPTGPPQQLTFGASEEDGLAVDPTGNSLITSIGTAQSALWVHDDKGERALSSEGEVLNGFSPPLFRENDTVLYFLLRRRTGPAAAELWRAEPQTGNADVVIPGVAIVDFDVSSDGKQVVYSTKSERGGELWLAPTDHSSFPARLAVQGASFPHFGPDGKILFQLTEGGSNFLGQMSQVGAAPSKVVPFPIHEFQSVSPGGHWAMALVSESPGSLHPILVAIPLGGGLPRVVCAGYCVPRWSSSDRFLFVPVVAASGANAGQSLVFSVGSGEDMSDLPVGGIRVFSATVGELHAKRFPRSDLVPGKDPEHYAFVKTMVQRNLFRVTLK